MKTFRHTLEVRGYELDSFGHVNNAVYLNYLEVARWKMLEQEGIRLEDILKDKLFPVISSIEIKYLKPSFMGDQLEIRTHTVEHGKARFHFEQRIYKGEELVASAQVRSVVVNEAGRPVEIPPHYERLWS